LKRRQLLPGFISSSLSSSSPDTSWLWRQIQRILHILPHHNWARKFFGRKTVVIHMTFIALVSLAAWQAHALESLDSSSLLYSYVSGDVVAEGPLDPSAYAQTAANDGSEGRLASAATSGGSPIDFTDLEINSSPQMVEGSALVAPNNPLPSETVQPANEQTPETPAKQPRTYTVQDGDTLAGIAQQFGISVDTVLSANKLSATSVIKPGDQLTILPTNGVFYAVKNGDTILSIADKFNVKADAIVEYNQLADSGKIAVGDNLMIPGGHLDVPVVQPRHLADNNEPSVKDVPEEAPTSAIASSGSWLWPTITRHISQYFGVPEFGRRHTGIDIDNRTPGTPIYAAKSGVVEFAGWNAGGYGNLTVINHGAGLQTYYGHASRILVKPGQTVTKGQAIAIMGSTGRSTGPHLHFEVRRNGIPINPLGMY
jgi:murein DD-endopeptidase MepM/ murein hydrolase activator NlpD